ncbi:MAG: hypothetical protein RR903_15135, partial [Edwardsiella sp. (in: enterobacteria)]
LLIGPPLHPVIFHHITPASSNDLTPNYTTARRRRGHRRTEKRSGSNNIGSATRIPPPRIVAPQKSHGDRGALASNETPAVKINRLNKKEKITVSRHRQKI